MKVILDRLNENKEIELTKLTVVLNDNIDYLISVNNFNELVIQKQQYGEGESSIVIKPSVSNEIRLS